MKLKNDFCEGDEYMTSSMGVVVSVSGKAAKKILKDIKEPDKIVIAANATLSKQFMESIKKK